MPNHERGLTTTREYIQDLHRLKWGWVSGSDGPMIDYNWKSVGLDSWLMIKPKVKAYI